MLTVDASVWVNADSPSESESTASRAFLDQVAAERTPVFLPTLLIVEIAAAISRSPKNPALARQYSEKLAALLFVRWIVLDQSVADRASAIAAEHGVRGADAVYAAVAVMQGCKLVSLDREHLTRLTSVLQVRTPSQMMAAK
jgi:predicted nucleic acid-binding protein